eukprot:CAMPEP_0197900336 /NCGR_PEP_ID=MMETSP1439-20131203/48846_1 /TAXON_ID=66791 /ORGANISM="Gonyaulax spinifera, Strain CCMP409" /LENGTH=44 /DNA_ID= /DNA_START= /DNA_END= /DNA_ORIENTATION=
MACWQPVAPRAAAQRPSAWQQRGPAAACVHGPMLPVLALPLSFH